MRQVLVSLCPHSTSRLPASCREIHDRVLGYIKMLPLLSELRAVGKEGGESIPSPNPIPYTHTYIQDCAPYINKLAQSLASSSHLQLRISALVLKPAAGAGAENGHELGVGIDYNAKLKCSWATACGKDTKTNTNANSDADVNAFADTDADVDEDAVVDENVDVDRWRTNCREAPGRVDADSWPCMEHK
ncbi:hypothetical protein ACLKA7_009993 [Drosophila subpalustris]